jgi:hypothetical protein
MKTYATPILLIAAALSLALLLSAATRTSSSHANAPARPTSTRITAPTTSSAAAVAAMRPVRVYRTRAACHELYGKDSDSHGELGACLAAAR